MWPWWAPRSSKPLGRGNSSAGFDFQALPLKQMEADLPKVTKDSLGELQWSLSDHAVQAGILRHSRYALKFVLFNNRAKSAPFIP